MNYTIIIPHKNIPDLLQRCLNSIPDREDIQIIIIDDNSNTTKVDFEHFPGLKKNNTEVVFTKEGHGAGYARNIGLSKAQGEWLIFADADDFFSPNAFSVFDQYLKNENDLVYFMMDSCYSDTMEKADRHKIYSSHILKYLENKNIVNEDNIRYRMSGPVAKMIKKTLIEENRICFDEVMASNDIMFSTKVGHYAKSVEAGNRTVYFATIRHGSLTKTRTKEIQFCRYLVQVRYNVFVKEIGKPELQKHLTSRIIESLLYFGPLEFINYLKVAYNHKINIFLGFSHFGDSITKWLKRKIKNDKYLIKN